MISVIIPIYNTEKYLIRCIESVRNQTYKDIEIILIDDGSIDGSVEICDRYETIDFRIRVFHEKNKGAAAARNLGLDVSRGEYIFFLDSDDYLDNNSLEIMFTKISSSKADMVVGDYAIVNEYGVELVNNGHKSVLSDCEISGKQFLIKNCIEVEKTLVCVWNKLYKKEIFDNLRYESGKLHEDEHAFHKICGKCKSVAIIGKVLYFYTQRKDSLIGNYEYERGVDILEAYLNRAIYMKKSNTPEFKAAYKHTVNMFFYLAFQYSNILGFDNENINMQMKLVRKEVLKFIPIFLKDTTRSLKERISCCIWMFSPRIYGRIWSNDKHKDN